MAVHMTSVSFDSVLIDILDVFWTSEWTDLSIKWKYLNV